SRQCRLTPMSATRFRRPQDRPRVWLSCPSQRPPKPVITSPDGGDQPWRVGGPLGFFSPCCCRGLREKNRGGGVKGAGFVRRARSCCRPFRELGARRK